MKLKVRMIGNSKGVIIPKKVIESYNTGDMIHLNVITDITNDENVITTITTKDGKNVITLPDTGKTIVITCKKWCEQCKRGMHRACASKDNCACEL